jgi:hypothetical protein
MPPVSKEAGKESLATAADFIKYTAGFATGALVFSIGLLEKSRHLSSFAAGVLIAAWALLSISVMAGVLAFSRIPIQQSEESYDLEDKYFTWPGKVHQLFFIFGILALGSVLIVILSTTHIGKKEFKVASALQAAAIAKQQVPKGSSIKGLQKIEMQPGVGDPEKALPVWLVALSIQKAKPAMLPDSLKRGSGPFPWTCTKNCRHHCYCMKLPEPVTVDTMTILIDAMTGELLTIP